MEARRRRTLRAGADTRDGTGMAPDGVFTRETVDLLAKTRHPGSWRPAVGPSRYNAAPVGALRLDPDRGGHRRASRPGKQPQRRQPPGRSGCTCVEGGTRNCQLIDDWADIASGYRGSLNISPTCPPDEQCVESCAGCAGVTPRVWCCRLLQLAESQGIRHLPSENSCPATPCPMREPSTDKSKGCRSSR